MLDVVDENDQVIGQAPRDEIHEKQWFHRAVHLLLISPRRHFLLQQRAESRPSYPGRWGTSASGHVASGNTYDETIIRETQEEIGYGLKDPCPLLSLEASEETDAEFTRFYVEEVESPPQLRADPEEVQAARWWTERELLEALIEHPEQFTPTFAILFFLWRQMDFLIPVKQPDGWYLIAEEDADRTEVQRGFLESAGLRARVNANDNWADPNAGRSIFDSRRTLKRQGLCVPIEDLPEAVALLFLSSPLDEETDLIP